MIKTIRFIQSEEFIMNLNLGMFQSHLEAYDNAVKELSGKEVEWYDMSRLSISLCLAISSAEGLIAKCDEILKRIQKLFLGKYLLFEAKENTQELKNKLQEQLPILNSRLEEVERVKKIALTGPVKLIVPAV